MDSSAPPVDGYDLLFQALSLIPLSHYVSALFLLFLVFIYNFLEFHFIHDLFTGFRGDPVSLTFSASSELYQAVVSKCRVLHGRYLPTIWLSGPHIQTAFLTFSGRAPRVNYRRQIFHTPDGGTIALDWLMHADVWGASSHVNDHAAHNDKTPIAIIVPGLTSDSSHAYVKHIAFAMAKRGWNVVVSNHRGLGGMSITSDCFYNAGWTEDVRRIIGYIHSQFPEAPLFAIGTSIGANILVKYLAEEGTDVPVSGAAAVCSPWDLLICDRFINRRLVQRFYNRVLTIGLQGYAQLHQAVLSRLTDWDAITKSRSVRDFDNHATRILGKYETVDTYYRRCSSVNFIGNVAVPLLCISSLDDPVCTREAIPYDECRTNDNIILATTQRGGHLAYHEGMSAASLWWVRAVDEFLGVLYSSPLMQSRKKMSASPLPIPSESSIDRGPYVNVTDDGMVAPLGDEETKDVVATTEEHAAQSESKRENFASEINNCADTQTKEETPQTPKQTATDAIDSVRRRVDQLSRQSCKSIWLLAYIAIMSSWPILGSALLFIFRKRLKKILPATMLKR